MCSSPSSYLSDRVLIVGMGRLLLGGKNSIKLGASKCRNGRLAHPTIDAFVGMNHQHVFALVETIDGADLHAVHQFALDATLVDDVGQLIVLPADRRAQIIHDFRHRGARFLAENERREDPRPLAGSERGAMRIQVPRGSPLLGCAKSLHRSACSPGKHRNTEVPYSQLQWSALGAGHSASPFALSRRAR